jgi:hypothetical protein
MALICHDEIRRRSGEAAACEHCGASAQQGPTASG